MPPRFRNSFANANGTQEKKTFRWWIQLRIAPNMPRCRLDRVFRRWSFVAWRAPMQLTRTNWGNILYIINWQQLIGIIFPSSIKCSTQFSEMCGEYNNPFHTHCLSSSLRVCSVLGPSTPTKKTKFRRHLALEYRNGIISNSGTVVSDCRSKCLSFPGAVGSPYFILHQTPAPVSNLVSFDVNFMFLYVLWNILRTCNSFCLSSSSRTTCHYVTDRVFLS